MISPLRIFILYRQEGFVQTQALYSMEAPWLPKSESGTRSPSLHLRHRGKAFSTKSPPSFSLEDSIHSLLPTVGKNGRRSKPRGSLRRCIRIPTARHCPCCRYHTTNCVWCQHIDEEIFIFSSLEQLILVVAKASKASVPAKITAHTFQHRISLA